MKKILSAIITVIAAVCIGSTSIITFADEKLGNYEVKCDKAKEATNGEKSISIPKDTFNLGRITKDTQIFVEYEITDGDKSAADTPVKLALQCMNNPDNPMADSDTGTVWVLVTPKSHDATSAFFYYEDLKKAYGSTDFSTVDYVHVVGTEKCSIQLKKMTIMDCLDKPVTTTTTTTAAAAAEEAPAETTVAATEATTTAAPAVTTAPAEKSSGVNPVILIAGIAGGVIITVIIVFIIINRKSREAFDVSTGKFIDKKKLFEADDENAESSNKDKSQDK